MPSILIDGNYVALPEGFNVVAPGVPVEYVVKSDEGSLIQEEDQNGEVARKGETKFPSPWICSRTVSTFRHSGCVYPTKTYFVFRPLLNRLMKEFPAGKLSTVLLTSLQPYADKYFQGNVSRWNVSTCEYYIRYMQQRESVSQASSVYGKLTNNNEVINEFNVQTMCTLSAERLGGAVERLGQPSVLEDTISTPVRDFKLRTDFQLEGDGEVVEDGEDGHVEWAEEGNNNPHTHRTIYFAFMGRGQGNFHRFANTRDNLCNAFKRLLKARPDEEEYRAHQRRVWDLVAVYNEPDVVYGPTQHTKITQVMEGRDYEPFVGNERVARFIAQQTRVLLDRMNFWQIRLYIDALQTTGLWTYNSVWNQLSVYQDCFTARTENSLITHVKKPLRIAYVQNQVIHEPGDIMVKELSGSLKDELAKFGKDGRIYVGYGAGAMNANELPEFVKVGMNGLHTCQIEQFEKTVRIVAKFEKNVLTTAFREVISAYNTPNSFYQLVYGDDQLYATTIGTPKMANVDISSNDSNQDMLSLGLSCMQMSKFHPDWALGTLRQLMLPIRVKDPGNKRNSVVIKFDGPFMGSGTTMTTISNNNGSYNCGNGVFDILVHENLERTFEECVVEGCKYAGHIVTCDIVSEYEKLQFLKFSPIKCQDGQYYAVRNYGTILRQLGSICGDLTAEQLGISSEEFLSMSHAERMDRAFSIVIAAYCNEPSSVLLDAFRIRFPLVSAKKIARGSTLFPLTDHSEWVSGEGDRSSCVVDEVSMALRYGCTPSDFQYLANLVLDLQVGDMISLDLIAKIFAVDYGVEDLIDGPGP